MSINASRVLEHLTRGDFRTLFINELGWDHASGSMALIVRGEPLTLQLTAEKRGVQVLVCPPDGNGQILSSDASSAVEREVVKYAHEHLLIFTGSDQTEHLWIYPRRETGRPVRLVTYRFDPKASNELLMQKLASIRFILNEEEELTLIEVTRRLKEGLDRDKLTKSFYQRFEKERGAFQGFIKGIPDDELARWYVAVLVNRLMFIYFIQEKGFLDSNQRYLQSRLGGFAGSYYRDFLCPLFLQGFALPEADRPAEVREMLGRVPYLNGGIFQKHQVEELHGQAIEIPNEAFQKLFAFFDDYRWHLDERPLAAGNEINPDVLGYIFEQYVNQKQMGAYYTKEDITEYITKNTVIPFLLDTARTECRVAFDNPGGPTVWDLLRDDPDRYIYPSVRHGVHQSLPDEISAGANSPAPPLVVEEPVQTLESRQDWNRTLSHDYALPTETWREVLVRRERYREVRGKLTRGEVSGPNDLVTLNLDIRQFTQDVVENCEGPDLLRALWGVIEHVTVLDPTCGSGAFLFAALNILEPFYEACLDRMDGFIDDLDVSGQTHSTEKYPDFRKVLARVADHPNRRYFVFKSIILNNLFGVDIMEEAVEICKLRLFLKLAAQIEPDVRHGNLGVEPLPDIDFNIKAGNSLVGFAAYEGVEKAILGGAQGKLDVFDEMHAIAARAADLQQTFDAFRYCQVTGDGPALSTLKLDLQKRLAGLQDELNRYLATGYRVDMTNAEAFAKWLRTHQPFHWFVEFYGIMSVGGFDVIIGNPPYAEVPQTLNRELLRTTFRTALDRWSRDEDLYTLVVERSLTLLRSGTSSFGMILPLSLAFSTKTPFVRLRDVLMSDRGLWLWSHFDRIPSALFGNEVRTRCTIALHLRSRSFQGFAGSTTSLLRWNSECREHLFPSLRYSRVDMDISAGIPKVGSQTQADALKALIDVDRPLAEDLGVSLSFNKLAQAAPSFPQPCVYVGGTAYNWLPAWRDIPETRDMSGKPSLPARTAGFRFSSETQANIVFALLCSSLGYWWWAVASDGFNLKKWLMERFPLSTSLIPVEARKELAKLGLGLWTELQNHYVYKDNKGRIGNYLLPACGPQISAIDALLGSVVPSLSSELFEDIRSFNLSFSRLDLGANQTEETGVC